jgi:hypothetical protein
MQVVTKGEKRVNLKSGDIWHITWAAISPKVMTVAIDEVTAATVVLNDELEQRPPIGRFDPTGIVWLEKVK